MPAERIKPQPGQKCAYDRENAPVLTNQSIAVFLNCLPEITVALVDPITIKHPPDEYDAVDDDADQGIDGPVIQPAASDQDAADNLKNLPYDRNEQGDIHHLPFPKYMRTIAYRLAQNPEDACGAGAGGEGWGSTIGAAVLPAAFT